jgi:hypothetical protein
MKTKPKQVCEREFDFTLVLDGITELTTEVEDALYNGKCDDGTLAFQSGRPYMTFSRTAPSLAEAILSAIQDVRNAGVGLDVLRVDYCDLVTPAEIARRIDRPRQAVHQYITGERGPGRFPPPACHLTDAAPLWAWCEVAHWLLQNNMLKEEVVRDALDAALINDILELRTRRQMAPETADKALKAIGGIV